MFPSPVIQFCIYTLVMYKQPPGGRVGFSFLLIVVSIISLILANEWNRIWKKIMWTMIWNVLMSGGCPWAFSHCSSLPSLGLSLRHMVWSYPAEHRFIRNKTLPLIRQWVTDIYLPFFIGLGVFSLGICRNTSFTLNSNSLCFQFVAALHSISYV